LLKLHPVPGPELPPPEGPVPPLPRVHVSRRLERIPPLVDNPTNDELDAWAAAVARGDHSVWNKCLDPWLRPRITRWVRRWGAPPGETVEGEAEDIMAAIYVAITYQHYRGGVFWPWCHRIARADRATRWRNAARRPACDPLEEWDAPGEDAASYGPVEYHYGPGEYERFLAERLEAILATLQDTDDVSAAELAAALRRLTPLQQACILLAEPPGEHGRRQGGLGQLNDTELANALGRSREHTNRTKRAAFERLTRELSAARSRKEDPHDP